MAVRCPECGSTNSPHSKFCSTCGFRLHPDAEGRCPHCGVKNPASNIFCDECGGRLVPATGPHVEPRGSSPAEGSVRGLSLPARTPSDSQDDIPDWLSQLRPRLTELPAEEEPVEQEDNEEGFAPATADDGLPDWLNEISESPGPLATSDENPEEDSEPGPQGEVPDWLREALEQPILGAEDDTLDSESLMVDDVAPEQVPLPPVPADLPDWLAEITPVAGMEDTSAAEDEAVDSIPDWLQAAMRKEPSPAPPETALEEVLDTALPELAPDELPAWLQEVEPDLDQTPAEAAWEAAEPGEMPSWLQTFAAQEPDIEPEPEPEPEPEAMPAEVAPDWLEPSPAEDQFELDMDQSVDVPDWLQRLATGPLHEEAQEPELAAEGPEGEDGDFPDWLQEFGIQETVEDAPQLAQPDLFGLDEEHPAEDLRSTLSAPTRPLAAEELKKWLDSTAPAGESPLGQTPELRGTGPLVPPELPDWLAAVGSKPETGPLPDWLLNDKAERPAAARKTGPLPEEPAEALPSWLTMEDVGPEPTAEPAAAEAAHVPDWLEQAQERVPSQDLSLAELPDWLVPPARVPAAVSRAPDATVDEPVWPELQDLHALADDEEEVDETLGLAVAEIPDWLQALRPTEEELPEVAEPEPMESGGPLNGLRGALVAQTAVISPPTSRALPKFVITEQQKKHVQALQQITRAATAAPQPSPTGRIAVSWLERALIPILVLLAVLVPALLPSQPFSLGPPAVAAEISDTYFLVELLPESAIVVVAFDYTPTTAGEMDAIAEPLLRQLMQRRARILAISTQPAGPALAQRSLDELAQEFDYQYGTDYLNLGYLPGGAVGLQAFAGDPWQLFVGADHVGRQQAEQDGRPVTARENPAAVGMDSLSDTNMVLILTAERDDLVGWIEQVGRQPGMERVPLVAGVSMGLEPWARPYFQNVPSGNSDRQLRGLVSGVPGATQFARQANQPEGDTATTLFNNQIAGLLVIILVLGVGLLWGTITGAVNRRRGHG